MRRAIASAAVAVMGFGLAAAGSAHAGVVTYPSTNVPRNVGDTQTVDSVLAVPAGRTPVQSIDVTNFGYTWPASGQELSARLISPDGGQIFLFEVGCFDSPAAASFTLTDSAPTFLPEKNFCEDQDLLGGSFKPVDPQNRKLSFFAGRGSSGTWILRSVDNGLQFQNQGSLLRWSLRITHAPPSFFVSGPGTANIGGPINIGAISNATGTVTVGGDANPGTTNLSAGVNTQVPFTPTPGILNQISKRGTAQANVSLSFADQTNGNATANVAVTLKGKKKKKKKRKRKKKP